MKENKKQIKKFNKWFKVWLAILSFVMFMFVDKLWGIYLLLLLLTLIILEGKQ